MQYSLRPTRSSRFLSLAGILGAALLAVAGASAAQAPPPARSTPKEVRAVWVVRSDLTTPQSVSRVVRHAKSNGLNTLFVQCRGRADAYYNGGLEPRAQALEKCAPDFDPLAATVAEAHAAGLQAHAWVNACYVWSEKNPPKAPDHMVNAHPDWLAVNRTGRRCKVGDTEVFICPGNPQARAHLVAVCRDLARRYDLDGLQLDYIRYADGNLCYCAGCLRRFEAYVAPKTTPAKLAAARAKGRLGAVQAYPWNWGQFRREQVTSLVREIRAAVKAERPEIQLTAAVISWGAYPGSFGRTEAFNVVAQDWFGWMRAGLVDAVCPMTYQTSLGGFKGWVNAVHREHPNFPVWFGIGAYLFSPESSAAKVQAVRAAGGQGWALFSYTSVTRGGTDDNYLRTLKARVIGTDTAGASR